MMVLVGENFAPCPHEFPVIADTGAEVTVIGDKYLATLGIKHSMLNMTKTKLKHVAGGNISVVGSCWLSFQVDGHRCVEEVFFITGVTDIFSLSLSACKALSIVHEDFPQVIQLETRITEEQEEPALSGGHPGDVKPPIKVGVYQVAKINIPVNIPVKPTDLPFTPVHHHSFNVSVPLKVGRTAPMFVLSFFLHSILLAGSALDSFQCLRSLLIVSFHVFFGLPRPRCPTTSNSVMLLIQPSFLTTCPNQRSRLYLNKVCMLLIPSFLSRESELMWSFKRTLHVHRIIARSLRCSLSRSLTLGGPTLTGIQPDSTDIRAVYLPTCEV